MCCCRRCCRCLLRLAACSAVATPLLVPLCPLHLPAAAPAAIDSQLQADALPTTLGGAAALPRQAALPKTSTDRGPLPAAALCFRQLPAHLQRQRHHFPAAGWRREPAAPCWRAAATDAVKASTTSVGQPKAARGRAHVMLRWHRRRQPACRPASGAEQSLLVGLNQTGR